MNTTRMLEHSFPLDMICVPTPVPVAAKYAVRLGVQDLVDLHPSIHRSHASIVRKHSVHMASMQSKPTRWWQDGKHKPGR
eukprot:3994518-Prymnesium_polylepis.3